METNELIKAMRQVIECYDYCTNPENPSEREIRMWRERFISEQPKIEDKEKYTYVGRCFLFASSEYMMINGPEKTYKENIKDL